MIEDKNKLIKTLQSQLLTLKEKVKDLSNKKTEDREMEGDEPRGNMSPSRRIHEEDKTKSNMIKTVTRQSVKFGAQR